MRIMLSSGHVEGSGDLGSLTNMATRCTCPSTSCLPRALHDTKGYRRAGDKGKGPILLSPRDVR